jgi:mannose-6-phosphate isomerase-like protein (cupin superfamily)/transcriptional regulator with XRE-family HTH domain
MQRVQAYRDVQPYVTKDGSRIRELMHPTVHGNAAQSLAEATIPAGKRTLLHRHHKTEEIYHVTGGRGRMTLGDNWFLVKTGDTVCIPPGTPHCIEAIAPTPLRILCCCAPAYAHDDTELLEAEPESEPQLAPLSRPARRLKRAPSEGPPFQMLRASLGMTQAQFWGTVLVTQSAGSRYESGRSTPAQVATLVRLAYDPEITARALLAELRQALPADYVPKATSIAATTTGESVRALRKRTGMSQTVFWKEVMVTQSGGHRYESGRDMPPCVQALVKLVFGTQKQAEALLTQLRQRAA